MEPDLTPLDDHLAEHDVDGYLIDADSTDPNQRYLSGFDAPDPFLTCYTPDGLAVLVSGLEYGRAVTESRADTVKRPADYDRRQLVAEYGPTEASHRVNSAFLADCGVDSVFVPDRFPLSTADGLREQGHTVSVDTDDVLMDIRAVKQPDEIDHIRAAQAANEAAMSFPQDKTTGYHADMTRTFCVGEPGETIGEWYDLTERALDAALGAVEAGASGADVHAAACEVYEDAGLPTFRTDPSTETGFIHTTGHGVGLAVHEQPRLSTEGGDLAAGQVITVEPGLYDPDVGGVRIEDIIVVTEDGYENLTDYPRTFVVD